jgi:hypothetical protein
MDLDKYAIIKGPDDFNYEFYSVGPNGRIKKIVRFTALADYEDDYFNLYLGDWLEVEHRASDTSVSNNEDRDKVLATVASIVVHFTSLMPQAAIFAKGSTPSRTRLYQIGITSHWSEIREDFDVQGFRQTIWERFQRNRNYEAFLLRRK